MDSNLRFPDRSAPIFETASPVSHDGLTISRPGTESSNPFPSSGESTNFRSSQDDARDLAAIIAQPFSGGARLPFGLGWLQ